MTKQSMVILVALAAIVAGQWVFAQEEGRPSGRPDRTGPSSQIGAPQRPKRPSQLPPGAERSGFDPRSRGGFDPRSGRVPTDSSEIIRRFDQQLEQKRRTHESSIHELEAIKKVALEEKAKKTAELVQKIIDKKNKEFEAAVEKTNEYREKMRERFGGTAQPGQRPPMPPDAEVKKDSKPEKDKPAVRIDPRTKKPIKVKK